MLRSRRNFGELEKLKKNSEYPAIDNDLFQVCEQDQIVTPRAKRMERFIHRMWANFARTGI